MHRTGSQGTGATPCRSQPLACSWGGVSSGPQKKLQQRKTQRRPRRVSGSRGQVRVWGSWRPSQLSRGLGYALRDLGELQAGAFHHAGLAAALVGTDHVAIALAIQPVILCACSKRAEAEGRGAASSPGLPAPAPCPPTGTFPPRLALVPPPTWNEVLLFGWREKEKHYDAGIVQDMQESPDPRPAAQ